MATSFCPLCTVVSQVGVCIICSRVKLQRAVGYRQPDLGGVSQIFRTTRSYAINCPRTIGVITQPGTERVQAECDILRSRYVVITTQPVHRMQIRPIIHN